jgi:hypothetical protein
VAVVAHRRSVETELNLGHMELVAQVAQAQHI